MFKKPVEEVFCLTGKSDQKSLWDSGMVACHMPQTPCGMPPCHTCPHRLLQGLWHGRMPHNHINFFSTFICSSIPFRTGSTAATSFFWTMGYNIDWYHYFFLTVISNSGWTRFHHQHPSELNLLAKRLQPWYHSPCLSDSILIATITNVACHNRLPCMVIFLESATLPACSIDIHSHRPPWSSFIESSTQMCLRLTPNSSGTQTPSFHSYSFRRALNRTIKYRSLCFLNHSPILIVLLQRYLRS